ncbi:hypothetical protein ACQCN2_13245 [Brevibacillus ginsengisoli]|uniref:hypothetical protein n=1 Tax=Brevibacillus ginsengisoli TaxID=363854 RepID=UPI003CFA4EC6
MNYGKFDRFFRSIFLSQGKHFIREGLRLSLYNLVYILVSITVVVGTFLTLGRMASIFQQVSFLVSLVVSLLFLVIMVEMIVSGAGYFVLWIRFIKSDHQKSYSPYKRLRALGISCLGVLPNVGILLLMPIVLPILFPADNDSCGGFVGVMFAYLIFFLSAVIMPLVGVIATFLRTPPQLSS